MTLLRETSMRLKYLGKFNNLQLENQDKSDRLFLDADKIVMVIPTGEVVPPQAHPENNNGSLKVL